MHYIALLFVSVHYCILLKEFVTYTQFAITPHVENTFINSHALSFNVQSCEFSPPLGYISWRTGATVSLKAHLAG